MITFSSVFKSFQNKLAVHHLTFEARKGDIIGFVGPNGAGKTTTMRLLLGYLTPTEGSIQIFGLNPTANRIQVLKKVGYLPENNPLYPEMRVNEYLSFIAKIKSVDQVGNIPQMVGLVDSESSKIEELSRGYKQRVGLAAALLGNPDILILDEPTSGLDPIEQEKIKTLIKKIARNKTIVFSTHILSEVDDVANRLIIINEGTLAYDGKKPKGKGAVDKLFKKLVQ